MKEEYIKAGKIASKVREKSKKLLKEGASIQAIVKKVESWIHENKGGIAFPVNISLNDYAAHDTASGKDNRKLNRGDVVKVDIGVHVNGFIADTAYTVEIRTKKHKKMLEANKEALQKVLKMVEPGVKLCKIGALVEKEAEKNGFKPIKNLSGHSLEQWNLHAGLTIPNYDNGDKTVIKDNTAVAIEPFFTNGFGEVVNAREKKIFMLEKRLPVRLPKVRDILKYIEENYKTFPFSKAWLEKEFGRGWVNISLPILIKSGCLKSFPALKEKKEGVVSQFEHTIVFFNGKKVITTL